MTAPQSETADAIVVGAGLNGAATALFLLQQGMRRVVILEASLPGAGASGAAVGLLRVHYDNRPETELAAKSMAYFRNWEDLTGEACGWVPTGFFRFIEPHELAQMETNVAVQRSFGERVEILSPQEVRGLAPAFRSDDFGAVVHEPDSGTASNARATCSLLRRAAAEGAILQPFTKAIEVTTHRGRVAGIITDRHRISAPVVILAAGAGVKALAATCGVDLPLIAKWICVAEVVVPDDLVIPGTYMDPISDSWLCVREQGRARISAPAPHAGRVVEAGQPAADFVREDAARGLRPVARRLPGIEISTVSRWWSRPDSYAPDGKPLIGPVPDVEGLFVNSAAAGKGHKVAPAAGRALAEMIAEGRATFADIAPFGLGRLRHPPQPWSASEYGKRVIG